MRCPQCQHENFPGEDYCDNCGYDLRDAALIGPNEGLGAKVITDTVMNLAPPEPLIMDSNSTVMEAVELMKNRGHGSVLIVDDGELKGIFTERDLLIRVVVKKLSPDAVKLKNVMTKEPQSLMETDSIAFALNRMSIHSIRHIPIMRNGDSTGFISVRGMLKYLAEHTIEQQ